MTIVPFLNRGVFAPHDIRAMSTALEDVCTILNLADEAKRERELLANKIVALAQRSRCDAGLLRDSMLKEIAYSKGGWPTPLVRAARRGAL